ncbi:MAG: hypothetical protein UZ21_OP11001000280 [Microgenomates bacterium OLB22]|nr:MAG: hypothetical protein UZ21_OP11001000280 [Microgenomates bacterium OLB22]
MDVDVDTGIFLEQNVQLLDEYGQFIRLWKSFYPTEPKHDWVTDPTMAADLKAIARLGPLSIRELESKVVYELDRDFAAALADILRKSPSPATNMSRLTLGSSRSHDGDLEQEYHDALILLRRELGYHVADVHSYEYNSGPGEGMLYVDDIELSDGRHRVTVVNDSGTVDKVAVDRLIEYTRTYLGDQHVHELLNLLDSGDVAVSDKVTKYAICDDRVLERRLREELPSESYAITIDTRLLSEDEKKKNPQSYSRIR